MAETPETSDHTSVKTRIEQLQKSDSKHPETLYPFAGNPGKKMPEGIPFRLDDYLELVDWSGRIIRDDKKGAIPEHVPAILSRLNIEEKNWLYLSQHFESPFKSLVGCACKVRQACDQLGKQWVQGVRRCSELFPEI